MPGANASDFFGEGTLGGASAPTKPKRDWNAQPPRTNRELDEMLREQGDPNGLNFGFQDTRTAEERAVAAYQGGNIGGASGAYNAGTDSARAWWDSNYRDGNWGEDVYRVGGAVLSGGGTEVLRAADGVFGAQYGVQRNGSGLAASGPVPAIDAPGNPNAAGGPGAPGAPGAPGTDPNAPPATPPPTDPAATPPTDGAPVVDRTQIDEALGGLGTYQNALWEMSQDNTGLSAAEAQLKKATELANIQAGISTEASQRAALGQARSARNRGDRAFLEQQAIGEAGFIGQEAARTAALRQAEAEGNLATLRANEETADKNFKLQAIKEAAALGYNAAALEVDIAKADLSSASNMLNQAFESMRAEGTLGLGYAQLDQQKIRDAADFTRDMAIIQQKYDQMDLDAQIETERLLMQKYNIDQTTMLGLKRLKQEGEFDWNGLLMQFAGGAGKGATAALFASDRRVKKNIRPVRDDELEELLSALKGETYDYVDDGRFGGGRQGRRFSFMAQDLEKTRLGKAMVKPFDGTGVKGVDTGAVAMATAGGLAVVYDRLKGLEEAVKS